MSDFNLRLYQGLHVVMSQHLHIPEGGVLAGVRAEATYSMPVAGPLPDDASPYYGIHRGIAQTFNFVPWESVEQIAEWIRSIGEEGIADAILEGRHDSGARVRVKR